MRRRGRGRKGKNVRKSVPIVLEYCDHKEKFFALLEKTFMHLKATEKGPQVTEFRQQLNFDGYEKEYLLFMANEYGTEEPRKSSFPVASASIAKKKKGKSNTQQNGKQGSSNWGGIKTCDNTGNNWPTEKEAYACFKNIVNKRWIKLCHQGSPSLSKFCYKTWYKLHDMQKMYFYILARFIANEGGTVRDDEVRRSVFSDEVAIAFKLAYGVVRTQIMLDQYGVCNPDSDFSAFDWFADEQRVRLRKENPSFSRDIDTREIIHALWSDASPEIKHKYEIIDSQYDNSPQQKYAYDVDKGFIEIPDNHYQIFGDEQDNPSEVQQQDIDEEEDQFQLQGQGQCQCQCNDSNHPISCIDFDDFESD